jgi:hypothetical protein
VGLLRRGMAVVVSTSCVVLYNFLGCYFCFALGVGYSDMVSVFGVCRVVGCPYPSAPGFAVGGGFGWIDGRGPLSHDCLDGV